MIVSTWRRSCFLKFEQFQDRFKTIWILRTKGEKRKKKWLSDWGRGDSESRFVSTVTNDLCLPVFFVILFITPVSLSCAKANLRIKFWFKKYAIGLFPSTIIKAVVLFLQELEHCIMLLSYSCCYVNPTTTASQYFHKRSSINICTEEWAYWDCVRRISHGICLKRVPCRSCLRSQIRLGCCLHLKTAKIGSRHNSDISMVLIFYNPVRK